MAASAEGGDDPEGVGSADNQLANELLDGGADPDKSQEDDEEVSAKIAEVEKAIKDSKLMKDTMTKKLDLVPLIITNLEKKPYDCTATISWLKTKTAEQNTDLAGLMDEWIGGKSLISDLTEVTKAEKLEKLTLQKTQIDATREKITQSYIINIRIMFSESSVSSVIRDAEHDSS